MAVDEAFHGRGLGTLLLERLAMLSIHRGFTRLWAVTHSDNLAMREVFRESGYPVHETYEGADMQVDLSLQPTESTATRSELRERIATTASLRPFFFPRSVAVIGASRDPERIGYRIVEAHTGTVAIEKVYVSVDKFLAWCAETNARPNNISRARYAAQTGYPWWERLD